MQPVSHLALAWCWGLTLQGTELTVHFWHLEVQIEPASPARHCPEGAHGLCCPICKIYAFILVSEISEQASNQGLESKPLASRGSSSAVSSCRVVLLATAQVSCLLARAMEVDLAFPCNPKHMGDSCAH